MTSASADGSFSTPAQTPLGGFLCVEPPRMGAVTERLVCLGVPDVSATLKQVVASGGAVVDPRTPVPGVVVLGLFADPAGNRMGRVEMKDARAVVPRPRAGSFPRGALNPAGPAAQMDRQGLPPHSSRTPP